MNLTPLNQVTKCKVNSKMLLYHFIIYCIFVSFLTYFLFKGLLYLYIPLCSWSKNDVRQQNIYLNICRHCIC